MSPDRTLKGALVVLPHTVMVGSQRLTAGTEGIVLAEYPNHLSVFIEDRHSTLLVHIPRALVDVVHASDSADEDWINE